MSYRTTESAYPGIWTSQSHGQSSAGYTQDVLGYSSRISQAPPQPGVDTSYYQHQYGVSQYSYSGSESDRSSYLQSTASPTCSYPVQTAGGYQSSSYNSTMPQYSPQAQLWPQTQPGPVVSGSRGMGQAHFIAPQTQYTGAQSPVVMSASTDTSYTYNSWPRTLSPASSSGYATTGGAAMGSGSEYNVPCPYKCGTVLTGVHAVGNMTRHLKSQNCIGSGKEKPKHVCPVQGCEKRYIRSDGLKVHLRKRHNMAHPSDRNGSSEYDEIGYGYS